MALSPPWSNAPVAYEDRIVAYFDVLGWKDIIARAAGEPTRLGQLRSLVGLYGYLQTQVQGDPHGSAITAFSDNVVVSQRWSVGIVQEFLDTIGRYQVAAALNGFFLRGAVTVGPLFHDGTSVFGPALVKAYELESREAIYPRIILDPDRWQVFDLCHFIRKLDGYSTMDVFGADFINVIAPSIQPASRSPSKLPPSSSIMVRPAALLEIISANLEASLLEANAEAVRTKLLWLKEQVEAGIAAIK